MIEGNGDLHVLVLSIRIAVSQQHDLIMVRHVIVGNGDRGGPMNRINQPIVAIGQGAMVHPNMAPTEDGHAVAVGYGPPPEVVWGVPHHSVPSLLAIVDVESMYDNVGHVLDGNAWPTGNVHARSSAVEGLERVHDQLLLEPNRHVALENDP